MSILYRSHKSLPVAAKVSSLYAFDALCRAARSNATKNGLTGDIHAPKGNSATFLLKVEGVLDGLVKDMISSEGSDAKVSLTYPLAKKLVASPGQDAMAEIVLILNGVIPKRHQLLHIYGCLEDLRIL